MHDSKIILGSLQETLLLPLWGRAMETQKEKPLLVDELAVYIVNNIGYNFNKIAKDINPLSRLAWIARSIYFDKKIRVFLEKFPEGSIVNIGCGLDTTFNRVDNGRSTWYELDLPEVIELRRKYIREESRRIFIAQSVFNDSWYSRIINKKDVLFLLADVIYYFEEEKIKTFFKNISDYFINTTILFDYCSKKGLKVANKKVIEKGGMNSQADLIWGIDNIYEIEKWDSRIRVIDNIKMFEQHKKNYPFYQRIGMNISDFMKIMSLAQVEISSV